MSNKTHTEAVGVFHDAASLRGAADDLMINGFDRADLSVLASQKDVERKLGHAYQSVSELEDDPMVATHAYAAGDSLTEAKAALVGGLFFVGAAAAAGATIASGGSVETSVLYALVAGGIGGLAGIGLAWIFGRRFAKGVARHLARGGLLLWVRTTDQAQETRAIRILRSNGAEHAHLHELPERSFGGKIEIYGYLHWLGDLPGRLRQQT